MTSTPTPTPMKFKPLDDLEMFEILQAAYPERFPSDDDETWEAAQNFADDICGWEEIAELLGRIVMLTMPMKSGITENLYHCLGKVSIEHGIASMVAAVRRDTLNLITSSHTGITIAIGYNGGANE